jgi:hypothetical protein
MPYLHWPIGFVTPPSTPLPIPAPAGYTAFSDLLPDILARTGNLKENSGITILSAANSILSLIYKKLLDRRSDILVTGNLSLNISAYGLSVELPIDFIAMAEKPQCEELYSDWMAGTVISYDPATGALVVNVTVSDGSDTLASWSIASAGTPENPSVILGTSLTSLAVGSGSKSLTASLNMDLLPGDYIFILPTDLPPTQMKPLHYLQTHYLDDDEDHQEGAWWEWYGTYGDTWEPPSIRPRTYKIIATLMYVRPKVFIPVLIKGRYFAKPVSFTTILNTIPWVGLFDDIFKEGIVRIIQKGISIPEADADFMLFLNGQFDTVVNTRINLIPNTGRLKRSNWL